MHILLQSLVFIAHIHKYTFTYSHVYIYVYTYKHMHMGWLRCVGSIKLYVSFAEYSLCYRALLQKRPIILSILLTKATPYKYITYEPSAEMRSLLRSLVFITHIYKLIFIHLYLHIRIYIYIYAHINILHVHLIAEMDVEMTHSVDDNCLHMSH